MPTQQYIVKPRTDFVFTMVFTVMVILFTLFSLVYLGHANAVATKGYKIKQLQEERVVLQGELDIWNLKLRRLQSISLLMDSDKVMSMNSAKDVLYVNPDSQVAYSK